MPLELFVVLTRGGAHDFAVDEQIDTSLARLTAAADEKVDKFAGDFKSRRTERPVRAVAAEEGIHQAFAQKAAYLLLVWQRPGCGALPKASPVAFQSP